VEGVAVRARAADAVAAKAEAIADGQARALSIVLERLTRAADHARLPKVAPERLESMIVKFSLRDERTSGTDYLASLTFHFDPPAVRRLLSSAGIPHTDRQAPPILVVPIYREGERFAFAGRNPHLDAWRGFDLENRLTPLRLPEGSVVDQGIDPNAVLARDVDAFAALRHLYRTQGVLIGLCETDPQHSQFTCSLEGAGPAGPLLLSERFAGGSDPHAVAQAAIGMFLVEIEEQWKSASAARGGGLAGARVGTPIRLRVSFAGLGQWQALRARLSGLPGVGGVEVERFDGYSARLTLYYAGGGGDLAAQLAGFGMELAYAGDHWVLRSY
jgi:hypothetical protein